MTLKGTASNTKQSTANDTPPNDGMGTDNQPTATPPIGGIQTIEDHAKENQTPAWALAAAAALEGWAAGQTVDATAYRVAIARAKSEKVGG